MKYATWNLKEESPNYFSGPESAIAETGAIAEASDWFTGTQVSEFQILGYIYGDFTADLSPWNFNELTAEQAIIFAKNLDDKAIFSLDGRIIITQA